MSEYVAEKDPIAVAVARHRADTLNEVTERMAPVFGIDMDAMTAHERSSLIGKTHAALNDFHIDKYRD